MLKYAMIIPGLVCLLILQACRPVSIRDTTSQSFIPIKGWTLILHQDITVAAERTGIYFQDGALMNRVNEFRPHCQLKVRLLLQKPQTIYTDHFTVTRVLGSEEEIAIAGHILLAAAGKTALARGGDGGDGPIRLMYVLNMRLHSEKQPNVTWFSCAGAIDEPYLAAYPTLQDIRASIGSYATFEQRTK